MKRPEKKLDMDVALSVGGLLDAVIKPEFMNADQLRDLYLAVDGVAGTEERDSLYALLKAYKSYIYELIEEEDPR